MPAVLRSLVVAVVIGLLTAACSSEGADPDSDGGDATTAPSAEPSERILALYEQQDVDAAFDAIAPGSVPEQIGDDLRATLQDVLARDVEIRATMTHTVAGAEITEVDTSDGIRWCIAPDGSILLQCRLGLAPVEVETHDVPVDVVEAEVDVFPEERQLRLQLRPSDEAIEFKGLLQLETTEGEPAPMLQVQAVVASQGEVLGQIGRDQLLAPGTTLLLAWVSDVDATVPDQLVLSWGGAELGLTVGEPEYFFD